MREFRPKQNQRQEQASAIPGRGPLPESAHAAAVLHLVDLARFSILPPRLMRAVAPSPVSRSTSVQIFGNPGAAPAVPGMTLTEFRTYTRRQADWFVEPTLSTTDRDDLWRLLLKAERGPHILSGLGDVQVSALRAVSAADWVPLEAFCRGSHGSGNTVRLFPPFPPLAERIALGRTLRGLEAVIPPAVLKVTVSHTQLVEVHTNGLLPRLTQYWTDFEPHLEQSFIPAPAARGPEFNRVLTFLNALGPLGLVPLLSLRGPTPSTRWIRNLHRFPLAMLQQLVLNLADTSGTKRLILVLHSAHDAAGAFQNAAALFSSLVTASPNNLVLMIEGATSISDMTTRIPDITLNWGQVVGGVRRISQVLIAGHGSPTSVGLAGTGAPTVTGGTVRYPSQSLRVGDAASGALLTALMSHMDPAAARILYAGCLVGASRAPAGTPSAGIPGALAAHQSLAAYTEAHATAAGIPGGRVAGARASVAIGRVTSLFDPATGDLSASYPFDPQAFSSANAYAQAGREPEGVLRAAVEVGAVDPVLAETLLWTRLAMPVVPMDWWDAITRLMVGLALPSVAGGGVNVGLVNDLANIAEVPFLSRWPDFNWIDGASFRTLLNPQPFAADVYTGMSATVQYTNPVVWGTQRLRILVDQGRLHLNGAAEAPAFLAGILATALPANVFEVYLDLPSIQAHAATLLPLGGPFSAEAIRLALAWLSRDPANAIVRSYLTAQTVQAPGAPVAFTPAVSTEIAGAGRTDREVLDTLGFAQTSSAAPVGGAPALPLANLALPGSGTNVFLLTGRPHLATVTAVPSVIVRRGMIPGALAVTTLATGASVRVMGFVGAFAALDVNGMLGFVGTSDLTPPPP